MRVFKNILVTGGCGFIGSNFIHSLFSPASNFKGRLINLDKLTYAGHRENLAALEANPNYIFIEGDIVDEPLISQILKDYAIDSICHFAAESHVDNSISGPSSFIQTNILGTFSLLEAVRKQSSPIHFHHVSTDEVYGSLDKTGFFTETTAYDPRSPYSASKASSDHLVMAYHHTYNLSVTMSNCSNNYGPYQDKEKLIPLMIDKLRHNMALPVYGDGLNVRDWIHVDDHNQALWQIILHGRNGERYNIGCKNEWTNIDLVKLLCVIMSNETGQPPEVYENLITYVKDRAGHDRRYAISPNKIQQELNWQAQIPFKEGLAKTVRWYLNHC